MKKYLIIFAIATCTAMSWAQYAGATMIFTDVSYTSNTVSFTIDGDMTGYALTPFQPETISIEYFGDIWATDLGLSANSWNQSLFDNFSLTNVGSTVSASGQKFSFSRYNDNLPIETSASSNDRDIVLTMGGDYLNPLATSGSFNIIWGHVFTNHQVLYSYAVAAPVPEPATVALLGIGLVGLAGGALRRRLKRKTQEIRN